MKQAKPNTPEPTDRRYITGDLRHTFQGEKRPIFCRIVLDTQTRSLYSAFISDGVDWNYASEQDRAELQQALTTDRADVFDRPEDFGLDRVKYVPNWGYAPWKYYNPEA